MADKYDDLNNFNLVRLICIRDVIEATHGIKQQFHPLKYYPSYSLVEFCQGKTQPSHGQIIEVK